MKKPLVYIGFLLGIPFLGTQNYGFLNQVPTLPEIFAEAHMSQRLKEVRLPTKPSKDY